MSVSSLEKRLADKIACPELSCAHLYYEKVRSVLGQQVLFEYGCAGAVAVTVNSSVNRLAFRCG